MSALLCGCQKDHVSELAQGRGTIQATIEEISATRTVMDENNNIRWSEGDQIVGFMKSTLGVKYQVSAASVGKTSASFEEVSSGGLNAGTELEHIIAYYPYSSSVSAAKSGSNYTLDVILPTEQTYVAESFGNGSMAMVAVSENNNITFRNVLGGMKLQLKGTQKVTSIKVEGKNGELLSGAATVTAYTDETKPAITMASSASTSVTLNCGAGVQLNETTATEFIIALPPVLFSKGFTVMVTDSYSQTYTVETDKSNEVIRSSLLVMPEVKLVQLCDYIDEYGINHGKGTIISFRGIEVIWAPVNCGYHSDNFKYGKLYQRGRKYGQGAGSAYGELEPILDKGPYSASVILSESNSNVFYYGSSGLFNHPQTDTWNSSSEYSPVKGHHDPCPDGWRVPTQDEMLYLRENHSSWTINDEGQVGYWFSGGESYSSYAPQIFLPAAGRRSQKEGNMEYRDKRGNYWTLKERALLGKYLYFTENDIREYEADITYGFSVRCVQE